MDSKSSSPLLPIINESNVIKCHFTNKMILSPLKHSKIFLSDQLLDHIKFRKI